MPGPLRKGEGGIGMMNLSQETCLKLTEPFRGKTVGEDDGKSTPALAVDFYFFFKEGQIESSGIEGPGRINTGKQADSGLWPG